MCSYQVRNKIIFNVNHLTPCDQPPHVFAIQYVHGDLCKHLGIDSSTDHPDWYSTIPKCLHKSPCACQILKNDLIL